MARRAGEVRVSAVPGSGSVLTLVNLRERTGHDTLKATTRCRVSHT